MIYIIHTRTHSDTHTHILLVLFVWRILTNTRFFVLPFELAFTSHYVEYAGLFTSCFSVIHENPRLTFSEINLLFL